MTLLTVTSRGQVTFRQEVLKHLGVKPGEKIELDLLPYGRAELKSVQQKGTFRALHGFLKGKTSGERLTIDESNTAISEAGAAAGAGEKGKCQLIQTYYCARCSAMTLATAV